MSNATTVRITSDNHGSEYRYAARATRYVQRGLLGTVCESQAIRAVVFAGKPNLAAAAATRAPGDWSNTHGNLAERIERHAS